MPEYNLARNKVTSSEGFLKLLEEFGKTPEQARMLDVLVRTLRNDTNKELVEHLEQLSYEQRTLVDLYKEKILSDIDCRRMDTAMVKVEQQEIMEFKNAVCNGTGEEYLSKLNGYGKSELLRNMGLGSYVVSSVEDYECLDDENKAFYSEVMESLDEFSESEKSQGPILSHVRK